MLFHTKFISENCKQHHQNCNIKVNFKSKTKGQIVRLVVVTLVHA